MHSKQLFFYIALLAVVSGCDRDAAKRMAYNAVQGAGRQQCMETTIASQWNHCMKQDSYDDYQRKREEAFATRSLLNQKGQTGDKPAAADAPPSSPASTPAKQP